MGNTCIPMADLCQCMAKPIQYCKVKNKTKQNKKTINKIRSPRPKKRFYWVWGEKNLNKLKCQLSKKKEQKSLGISWPCDNQYQLVSAQFRYFRLLRPWFSYPLSSSQLCDFVVVVQSLSRIRRFATLWTVACQAPLSMEFSRQEYWSG